MAARLNSDVKMQPVNAVGAKQLKELLEAYVEATESEKAKAIFADFDNYLPKFVHVPSSEADSPEVSGVEKAAVADGELVSA